MPVLSLLYGLKACDPDFNLIKYRKYCRRLFILYKYNWKDDYEDLSLIFKSLSFNLNEIEFDDIKEKKYSLEEIDKKFSKQSKVISLLKKI